MSKDTSSSEEEIDLGHLFTLIGNSFSNVFKLIKKILTGFWAAIVLLLLFFRNHFKEFIIIVFVGLILGVIMDYNRKPLFESSMVVQPNFQSGRQLYKNVSFYDNLVDQKDTVLLAQIFNLTSEEAASLTSFEITPVINEITLLSDYDKFIQSIDSVTAIGFDFDLYKDNFEDYDFRQHEIVVISSQKDIFNKLEKTIVESIVGNNYFKKQREINIQILNRNDSFLQASLVDIDTLRQVHKTAILTEASKTNSQGTNINLGSSTESSSEIKLFKEETRINSELDEISSSRAQGTQILNVVSSFPKIGFSLKNYSKRFMFIMPVSLVVLLLVFLIGKSANSYLKKVENRRSLEDVQE